MKGWMKTCSDSLVTCRGWRIRLPRESVYRTVGWYSFSGSPLRRWIEAVKDCLRKRVLDVRQAKRMVQDRSEWKGLVRGCVQYDIVVGCHSYMRPLIRVKVCLWLSLQFKGHKGENYRFVSLS